MKQQIENLQASIGKMMQEYLADSKFETVNILSPLLARVQELQKRNAEIERDVSEIESILKATRGKLQTQRVTELVPQLTATFGNGDSGRGRLQTLKILVDWRANKRNREPEEICENTAAASMATFIGRTVQEFGQDVLPKLSQVRINRGPLVSKTPARDFVNQAQGKLYGHKKIRGSDYFVLTHSPTAQKIEDIHKMCHILGFVPGSVKIEQVGRHAWLEEITN